MRIPGDSLSSSPARRDYCSFFLCVSFPGDSFSSSLARRDYCSFCVCVSFPGRGAEADRPLRVEGERGHQELFLWPSDAAERAAEKVPRAGLPAQVRGSGRLWRGVTLQPHSKEGVPDARLAWHPQPAMVRAATRCRALNKLEVSNPERFPRQVTERSVLEMAGIVLLCT